jgi:lysophospholipase L1-like esterase
VFILGGSTVQGRPYAIETAFSSWLELSLPLVDPSRQWEVVNCGGVSYASYRLAPILQEILSNYQPDLIILYTGHNEFLEDRAYDQAGRFGSGVTGAHRLASASAVYRAARTAWARYLAEEQRPRPKLAEEVDTLLDHEGGLESYRRDDPWRSAVMDHFQFNVQRMVHMCRAARTPIVLCNPVVNLRDCPPFKFSPSESLAVDEQHAIEERWREAKADDLSLDARIDRLRALSALDPRHAGIHFHLAKCLEAAKEDEAARLHFVRAKDEDLCPLRILEPMREQLRRIAELEHAPLVDIEGDFSETNSMRAAGNEWMVDHVHPTIEGHQRIAAALLNEMIRQGWVRPIQDQPTYQAARREAFRRHLATLDESYFGRGQQRLEGLRRWTQGRAHQALDQ